MKCKILWIMAALVLMGAATACEELFPSKVLKLDTLAGGEYVVEDGAGWTAAKMLNLLGPL